ncbi:MAG: TonB-dependent receptor, partial [Gammaproteobacteria bacterium]
MKKVIQGLFTLSCTLLINNVSAAEEPMIELDTVEVFGVTPLSGSGVSLDKIPSNVQVVDSKQLQDAQSTSLADYINRYLAGVHINEAQNNPLQPDVYYRGFVASPLLGLPQGLSVYVNGVRFNEPFGDTVNWDLIPQGAIDTMSLFPGSNPVFGLNTLGGALSIKTKTGFSAPGHQLEVSGGSWERHSEELTSGWNDGTWGYFIDLHHFEENGWRDYSPTEANQVFGTLSWRGERGELDLTLGANDNNMKGNGAVPTQLHQEHRKAIFTHPDQTITRMFFSELSGLFDVTDTVQLSGNAYFRQNRIKSFNGDDSDFEACDDPNNQFICDEDDEIVDDLEGNSVLVSDVYGPLDPEDTLGSTNNTSQTYMRSSGGTFQSMFSDDIFGYQNNFIIGAAYDYADVHFESDTELGLLTESRGTTGSGVLVEEAHVRLNTVTKTYGIYFSDSFSVTDDLTVTLAGRYNHSKITLNNQYINGEDKLSGEHSFDRFNPSAGFTYQVVDSVGLYGSYSESARVPTPMELSCADEDDPCKLPNAFIADPPLDQVVAKTWEAGVRGNLNDFISDGDVNWNIGFFHTINHDDIIFNRGGDSISE